MSTVIKVENLSKQYRLGTIGTGTISHDVNRWWYTVRGKENPYLKIGEENDRTATGKSDYVWALRDINFEVQQGQVLGIIGRNGAGKSTLLKILSRTTTPTTGAVKIKGRVASLLEVGTGFHPELTGRENIFLNGAILGMTKREIKRKFDEILDFSGVEKYIDTPVKRYSSGMYVRLAFGVAAHLDPEILIVDEVLAVGDAEFQKKCLGKMKDVSEKDGRTVLFVSHNMAAVKELCDNAILLKKGLIHSTGATNNIVREYLLNPALITCATDLLSDTKIRRGNGEIRFTRIVINNGEQYLDSQESIRIEMSAKVNIDIEEAYFSLLVRSPENAEPITTTELFSVAKNKLRKGENIHFTMVIQAHTFRTGLFPLYFWIGRKGKLAEEHYPFDIVDSVYYFNISSDSSEEELGYNSVNPAGYFNFRSAITDIRIS